MVNGCEVTVGFEGDGAAALGHIAAELEKLGYKPKSHDDSGLTMHFGGKWFTTDPNKMRHSVSVIPREGHLSFKFGTGLVASKWSASDIDWAQSRANAVVAAISA